VQAQDLRHDHLAALGFQLRAAYFLSIQIRDIAAFFWENIGKVGRDV